MIMITEPVCCIWLEIASKKVGFKGYSFDKTKQTCWKLVVFQDILKMWCGILRCSSQVVFLSNSGCDWSSAMSIHAELKICCFNLVFNCFIRFSIYVVFHGMFWMILWSYILFTSDVKVSHFFPPKVSVFKKNFLANVPSRHLSKNSDSFKD